MQGTSTLSESRATLTLSVSDGVAEILLNRPELNNRIDADAHAELSEAIQILPGLGVRAAIIGSTGPVFSAGGDFEFILRAHDDLPLVLETEEASRANLAAILALPFPLIAAVQGAAVGLGATIALACDMIVAARSASFSDPHVRVGLAAGDGGCLFWPQAMGMPRAKRFLLTGDRIGAVDAYAFGLITDLVDTADEALPAARALAARIAALPPLAVQGTKRALSNVMRLRAAEVVDLAASLEARTILTDDLIEAINAAKERRPGKFEGR